jgi:hypothetical protein
METSNGIDLFHLAIKAMNTEASDRLSAIRYFVQISSDGVIIWQFHVSSKPRALILKRESSMRLMCYEPMNSGWTEEELLDSKDGGVLLESWTIGHVMPRNVDQ